MKTLQVKEKRWWGCPECGQRELIQKTKFSGTRDVRIVGDREPMPEEIDERERSIDDVDDYEDDYECMACGHQFDRPARIVSEVEGPGFRLELRIQGKVFATKKLKGTDYFIEEELEDGGATVDRTVSAFPLASKEQALAIVRLAERMIAVSTETVK